MSVHCWLHLKAENHDYYFEGIPEPNVFIGDDKYLDTDAVITAIEAGNTQALINLCEPCLDAKEQEELKQFCEQNQIQEFAVFCE